MNVPRPMWYPSKDYELQSIPITHGYPFPVEQPMKRVWTFPSRIGLMVEALFTNKVTAVSRFSILTKENVLDFYKDKKLKCKMSILSLIVSSPFYKGGYLIVKIIQKISNVVNSMK